MPSAIDNVDCNSVEEFFNYFGCANKIWGGTRNFWVFRGHSDDVNYKLIPNALRNNPPAELGYTFDPLKGIQNTNRDQIDAEFRKIHEFYWSIDAQGLHVPGDYNLFRTPLGWMELQNTINAYGWPVDALLPLLALGQHYGIPTRLLDWSDRPLVAAYFAAKGSVVKKQGTKTLSVWALNLDWVVNTAFPSTAKKMYVYIITAPRASNPNLHAQGGVFTTEIIDNDDFHLTVTINAVDTLVENQWNSLNCNEPVMAHIKLPCSEAGKLLRLLNQEGISSATLFPGYQGVAESLKEREYWDTPQRMTYWMK